MNNNIFDNPHIFDNNINGNEKILNLILKHQKINSAKEEKAKTVIINYNIQENHIKELESELNKLGKNNQMEDKDAEYKIVHPLKSAKPFKIQKMSEDLVIFYSNINIGKNG